MSTLVIIVIGLFILMTLLSPFFLRKSEHQSAIEQENDGQEKEHIFSQLADLEYDYQMGKLSESDFNKTKAELTVKAARFVQSSGSKLEQVSYRVDNEIDRALDKQGLEPKKEGAYER
ncbi:hypothetical protein [Radiobacillus sp. PE A8.2]|uniref:hypothetical protein n=1 Tax=Radiobacillus sp. PE A8.2 TaxID=3380349 RepID=UPI00388F36BD